ncbi:YceI family protein [Mesonia mobilis]|uniref:YceI family protein n=1 Tax=Mesonia mobilis TaxID=369791 RepID=UPI003D2F0197
MYRGHQKNPANNKEAEAFQITGTLKRSDFNIGNDFPESLINDEVKIEANIEFIQQ